MQEEYDIIIIGAGHNGLVCAAYLAKAGLKTINIEKRDVVGGAASTEEVTLPGFKHVTHSNYHGWIHLGPVYKELEVAKYHKYIFPDPSFAIVFEDRRSILFHTGKGMDPVDRTCKSIERFSLKDAKTYREIYSLHRNFSELTKAWLFSPPLSYAQQFGLLEETEMGREFLREQLTSGKVVIEESFESDQVKAFMLSMQVQVGVGVEQFGTGSYLPTMISLEHDPGWGLSVGGSVTLGLALARIVEDHGGKILVNSPVERILVKDGVATGVELSNGRKIIAKKGVVSNIDPAGTFLKLTGEDYLEDSFIKKVKRYRPGMAVVTPHYALNEPIRYKAAEKDPQVNRSWGIFIAENADRVIDFYRNVHAGIPPKKPEDTMFIVVSNTLWDPTQAPAGKHTAFYWMHQPYHLKEGGAQKWAEIKEEVADIADDAWREYALNLTEENILARHVDGPLDYERKMPQLIEGCWLMGDMTQDQAGLFRPFHGYPPYRSPIENLYMCGACNHPGGGISGAPGYNCAGVICEDLNVKKWWSPMSLK
ncbi:MAG: NAD(P)/FAD-dependent oxidoreductase [Thermodesulfobacteriota bacterium]|nr:NAD(P)/FAD-dependent oxidoreductase [Thermodesulfobacteriota bacterium]